ncbi:MAG TPA: transposase [Usitatibacter sp.]|nr:transposase [Usitatibacter sp.]
MPRHSRCVVAGVALHVIQRGNNRSPCFNREADRRLYLALLRELCDLYECSIHAYVLMTNHVHLLATPDHSDSMSLVMKHLGQRYVQYVNRRYARSGSLWEGRFRSSMVDSAGYALVCQRYIESNPVRAGIVQHPGEYPWSSFGANALGHPSDIVVPRAEYLSLGEDDLERRMRYAELFNDGLGDRDLARIRDAVNGGFALGSDSFVREIEGRLHRRATRGKPGRPSKAPDRSTQ